MAEINLAYADCMARFSTCISCTKLAEDLTENRVVQFATYQEAKIAYKYLDDKLKLMKIHQDKIFKFINNWPKNLALSTGENGRPLSYILRDSVAIVSVRNDPTFGELGTEYDSMRNNFIS